MSTLRDEVEAYMGVSQPAKIGRRYHTAAALPPSHWRRSLKGWVLLALGWVGGTLFTVAVIILWKVWV
jgi:hypothetical protein